MGPRVPVSGGPSAATLSDLCSLIVDSERKTAPKDADGLHPLMRTTNLGLAQVDFGGAQRVNADTYERWTKRARPQEGDLILAREAPVGGVCRVPASVLPVLGQRTVLLRPCADAADGRFLMYRLAAPDMQARMSEMATGATVPHLNMADIRALAVPDVPEIGEQRRRATVLAAFDALVEINERRIALLEDLARSLYREWFVRFRFPGHGAVESGDPIRTSPGPAWDVVRLSEVVTTQYGFTASAENHPVGPKLLRGMDINKRSYIDWSSVPHCEVPSDRVDRFRLHVGDVCVIRMADPGKVGIVERPVDAVFASYLVRLRSTEPRLPPLLLFHYLDANEYQSWVSGSSTGATRKSASAAVLTEPCIALPPLTIAKGFETKVSEIRAQLAVLVEANAALAKTRDLLLPRVVTGRLDVCDIDLGALLATEGV